MLANESVKGMENEKPALIPAFTPSRNYLLKKKFNHR